MAHKLSALVNHLSTFGPPGQGKYCNSLGLFMQYMNPNRDAVPTKLLALCGHATTTTPLPSGVQTGNPKLLFCGSPSALATFPSATVKTNSHGCLRPSFCSPQSGSHPALPLQPFGPALPSGAPPHHSGVCSLGGSYKMQYIAAVLSSTESTGLRCIRITAS